MPARLITVGVLVASEKPHAVLVPYPARIDLVEGDVGGEITDHTNRPAVEQGPTSTSGSATWRRNSLTAVTDCRRWLRRFIESYVYSGIAFGLPPAVLVGIIVGVDSVTGKSLFLAVGVCAGIAIGAYLARRKERR